MSEASGEDTEGNVAKFDELIDKRKKRLEELEDQHLDAQITALEAIGAERIFAEKISGTKKTRPELNRMIEQLRDGDVVVVTKYDRLSRSLQDLLSIVEAVRSKGAGFRSLAEDIDTTTPA